MTLCDLALRSLVTSTASPIRRMGTSVWIAGRESSRPLRVGAVGGQRHSVAINPNLRTCHFSGGVCRETLYLSLILALGKVFWVIGEGPTHPRISDRFAVPAH